MPLNWPFRSNEAGHESVFDRDGKQYLDIESHGEQSHDSAMIERLIRSYVAFSPVPIFPTYLFH